MDMPVWQKAMNIAELVFKVTETLPKKEDYGFTSQIRRSALSMSANIAEAFGRKHIADKINFYYISRGSLTETQSHVEYGKRVGYIDSKIAKEIDSSLSDFYNDINKVISSLNKSHE
jgi:four helix bundle protein